MLIIDNPKKLLDKRNIYVPSFQRGHLSLKDGTQVTVCLIPREHFKESKTIAELIVTPVNINSWKYLWRINVSFRDYTGIVRDILKILAHHDISVLHYDTCAIENRNLHHLEIVVDVSLYAKVVPDIENEKGDLPELRMKIAALCCDKLKVYDQKYYGTDRPNFKIKIRRVNSLHIAYEDYIKYKDKKYKNFQSYSYKAKIRNHCISLSSEMYNRMAAIYNCDNTVCIYPPMKIEYLLVSDTKDRILRIIIPKRDEKVIYSQIGYDENIGVLSDITREIAIRYDIIASYNHVHQQDTRSYLSVIVSPIDESIKNLNISEIKDDFKNMLSQVKDHELDVMFPESAGHKIQDSDKYGIVNDVKEKSVISSKFSYDISMLSEPIEDILRQKEEYYYKLTRDEVLFDRYCSSLNIDTANRELERQRITNITEILRRYMNYIGSKPEIRSVFISNDSEHTSIFENIADKLEKIEINVYSAIDYRGNVNVKDKIMEEIKKSDAFLGIWKLKENKTLSPWMLWELGVAEHLKKKIFIMYDDKIPKEIRDVYSEKDSNKFNDATLDRSITKIITAISKD